MSEAAAHIIVSGLVQGVGFRFFVARKAGAYGLTGYVRNLADGNVEIRACGNRGLVEELIAEIRIGPRASRVRSVSVEWVESASDYDSFLIQ